MNVEILTAIIAAVIALASTIISIYGQGRITKLAHQLNQQSEEKSRETKVAEIMARYRDPLIRSAIDLQRRIYSTVRLDYLEKLYQRSQAEQNYAIQHTLFLIAEYLGWVEILRREIQFLDLGDIEMNRRLMQVLFKISDAFFSEKTDSAFRIYYGEQRAIGEIMISVGHTTIDSTKHECIGYASFVKRFNDPEFAIWFGRLKNDFERKAEGSFTNDERLIVLQHALIDLIDFLDPEGIRTPKEERQKISSVTT